MKKIITTAIITLLIVSLAIASVYFMTSQQIISDGMITYDDFETGLHEDKWKIKTPGCAVVSDGTLTLNGGQYSDGIEYCHTESKRRYSTDDIKLYIYSDDPRVMGGHGAEFDGLVIFSNVHLPIPKTDLHARCAYPNQGAECPRFEGILEIKRYDDFDLNRWVAYFNGIEIANGTSEKDARLRFVGHLNIDYVNYEPCYSCLIDYETEVVVRDTFSGGSEVHINHLTYHPTKLCPRDLGVLIFSDKGLTDEKGSITEALSRNETRIVPDNQYYQIDYITKYVDDMKERCGLGEVYDTTARVCIKSVYQQIPTETLLYCKSDVDCLVPNNCEDATVKCIDNQCDYTSAICTQEQIINYVEVVKTVEIEKPKIIILKEEINEVIFNDEKIIAGQNFKSETPKVSEEREIGELCYTDFNTYLKTPKCYSTEISWNFFNLIITSGTTVKLNDYVNLTYRFTGKGVFRSEEYDYAFKNVDDAQNTFTLSIAPNGLEIKEIGYEERYNLNEKAVVNIEILNNLFYIRSGGFKVNVHKGLRDIYGETEVINKIFQDGLKEYEINLPTDELGIYSITLTPFFLLSDNKEYYSNGITFSYFVESIKQDCSKSGCEVGTCQSDGTCKVDKEVDEFKGCQTDEECKEIRKDLICSEEGFCYTEERENIFEKLWDWIKALFER